MFIFLLSVFMITQFFLTQEMTGKDNVLQRLQAQIRQLTELLSLERATNQSSEGEISALRASLAALESERDRLRAQAGTAPAAAPDPSREQALSRELDMQKDAAARALQQIELLNQQILALRRQMPRWKRPSTSPRSATGRARRGSPISDAGSTWPSRSGCRN